MDKYTSYGKLQYVIIFICLTIFIRPCFSQNIQNADSVKKQVNDSVKIQPKDSLKQAPVDSVLFMRHSFTAEELIRGERLFYGLAYTKDKSVNCSACHNTRESDTLNWNPDGIEISVKYHPKSPVDLSSILLKPRGKKLSLVHKGFQLSSSDIVLIKAYMDTLPEAGMKRNKPVITYLLLFIIALVIFLVSVLDVVIKKLFKKTWINWLLISITGTFITVILAVNAVAFGRATGFSPAQPVKFSHAVHAGQNQIDCNYCHYSARSSKSSGIPPGSICHNCHFVVRNGTRSGVTEIAKVLEAYDNRKAVEWVRIYRLPDFVFFSHAQHVTAGGLKCEECHGTVNEMDRLVQVPDLSMGWCIRCHDTTKVNMSNNYYKQYYPDAYNSLKNGTSDSLTVTDIGGRNCGKCHY